jgi:hypothetical protein
MARRGLIPVVLLNVIISAAVAFGIISVFSEDTGGGQAPVTEVILEVVITATPDANATVPVRIITATFQQGVAQIPPDVLESDLTAGTPRPTIDPSLLGPDGSFLGQSADLPENCIEYFVVDGDNPSLIAVQFDVDLFTLLAVNGLTEETATSLQIGDRLIVPLEGCPLQGPAVSVNEDTEDTDAVDATPGDEDAELSGTPQPTVRPTVTLAPTASNAQMEIVEVIGAGDITTEQVSIRNNGNTVDISGWTLSDGDDNSYTFPDGRRLFSGSGIFINTRQGQNTPVLFFWGRDEAVFGEPGDVIVLADRNGNVQASLRLP